MDCHSDNPFAIPDKCLTSAPAVIPACLLQAGAGRNPVVYCIHSRPGGNDHMGYPCKRHRCHRPDISARPPGFLGRLFPTPLYHPALTGTPPKEGNWHYLGGLFPTCLLQAGRNDVALRQTAGQIACNFPQPELVTRRTAP